jgi:ABC-2 type transport system ATP-binding protein
MTATLRCDLSYTYPSGFAAGPLRLDLGPGVHQLLAPNGRGKTTLLRCLCGENRRARGELSVCGHDPRHDVEGRRGVAYLAADPELPDVLTVDEAWQQLAAIRGAPRWDGDALRERLDVPGPLPLGHCSAGQRRLAELLAAAAGDPPVMLLDEPFANLDPDHLARVVRVLEDWRSDRVVLLTSHTTPPLRIDTTIPL